MPALNARTELQVCSPPPPQAPPHMCVSTMPRRLQLLMHNSNTLSASRMVYAMDCPQVSAVSAPTCARPSAAAHGRPCAFPCLERWRVGQACHNESRFYTQIF
jgi:hypothetical protein